jgi:hypothetical protein
MQDTIAVVFDFDETLAPDSTSSFLGSLGIDIPTFWRDEVGPLLVDGWDPVPAYLYKMIEVSQAAGPAGAITRKRLAEWGKKVELYAGGSTIFQRIRRHVKSVNPSVAVEFYLISSGIGEILRTTKIAKNFTAIWACEFHYNGEGEIAFPRNIVSFTDKTRYLFYISKGLIGPEYRSKPFEVNRKIDTQSLRVPFDQMVFVGDGYTDIPCFSLVRKQGGVAIGVYDPKEHGKWGRAWGFVENDRVSNLVPADYGSKAALHHTLLMAVEAMANKVALRRSSYQG